MSNGTGSGRGGEAGGEGEGGSTETRTHLANERTFLAWLRTAITLIALGLAAGRFRAFEGGAGVALVKALASVLIAGGMCLAVAGWRRYTRSRDDIASDSFQPAGRLVAAAMGLVLVIGTVAATFVLALPR